ncbi:MAG: hypothetical protein GF401_10865 [Chitinivibrionales bacterium]|nr:hypothetical protein [Chitinivibrionales bacterium]
MRKKLSLFLLITCIPVIFFCTSRALQRADLFSDLTHDGDYVEGVEKIRQSRDLYGNLNRLLYHYDQGVLFHYAGLFDSSLAEFQKAEQISEDLYARSITNEAASLLTNDNLRPYRGWRFERILLHQLMSFNYLGKDEYDESLVETRKVQLVIDNFRSKGKGRDKYHDDGMSHYFSSIIYAAQGEPDNAHISLFKSVRAYKESPVALPDPVKNLAYYEFEQADREEDIKLLELEPAAEPENIHRLTDDQSEIIFVGYAGNSPILGEVVWWGTYVVDGMLLLHHRNPQGDTVLVRLPAPPIPEVEEEKREGKKKGEKVKSGQTFHIKFALPSPVFRNSETSYFTMSVDSSRIPRKSFVVSNLDRIVEKELQDNQPIILARTALRVVLRTIAAQKAKAKMQTENGMANFLLNVGADILSSQLEKADTRICFLLPKTIQCIRIPVEPGTHIIDAAAHTSGGAIVAEKHWSELTVAPGEKKFVFFPSLR